MIFHEFLIYYFFKKESKIVANQFSTHNKIVNLNTNNDSIVLIEINYPKKSKKFLLTKLPTTCNEFKNDDYTINIKKLSE